MQSFLEHAALKIGDSGVAGAYALVFYFMVYAFAGWILENGYSRAVAGTWKEPFLWGPFKPMYGLAPVLLLLLAGGGLHWSLLLLFCFLVPSAVEYASGWLLQKLFHRRWWDYTGLRFQLHGHVCLRFSFYWLLLCFGCLYALHPLIAALYASVVRVWLPVCPLFVVYLLTDLIWTIRNRRAKQTVSMI